MDELFPKYERRYGGRTGTVWMVNYDVDRALANYHWLAAQMESPASGRWPRIFASRQFPAIVIATCSLDGLRDPHVMTWKDSFVELGRAEFLQRVEECMCGTRRFLGEMIPMTIAA